MSIFIDILGVKYHFWNASMVVNSQLKLEDVSSSGDRLSLILDHIGFPGGHGRVKFFHEYLVEKSPEYFSDLSYGSTRNWLNGNVSPTMKKIDLIFDALGKEYPFNGDVSNFKVWWKLGGNPPADISDDLDTKSNIANLEQQAKDNKVSRQFAVISMLTEELGEAISALTDKEKLEISDYCQKAADDFANPYLIECPKEYLKAIMTYKYKSILKDRIDESF